MIYLIVGLVLFLGIHSVEIFSPAFRGNTVARIGEGAWKGIYSLLSIAGFVLWSGAMAWRARSRSCSTRRPYGRAISRRADVAGVSAAAGRLLPGRIKAAVKHPMLVAIKTWALAHLIANGMLADVLLFGGFLAWAVADRISLKRRVVRPHRAAVQVQRSHRRRRLAWRCM